MKIKYEFVTGEIFEIEVPEDIGEIAIAIDKETYNSDRRETRRHESYSDDNDKRQALEDLFTDVEAQVLSSLEYEVLNKAIKELLPQQQELLHKIFFEGRTMAEIAREEGVSAKAIQDRVNKIKNKLRKKL